MNAGQTIHAFGYVGPLQEGKDAVLGPKNSSLAVIKLCSVGPGFETTCTVVSKLEIDRKFGTFSFPLAIDSSFLARYGTGELDLNVNLCSPELPPCETDAAEESAGSGVTIYILSDPSALEGLITLDAPAVVDPVAPMQFYGSVQGPSGAPVAGGAVTVAFGRAEVGSWPLGGVHSFKL
jgi:hypothetical protein